MRELEVEGFEIIAKMRRGDVVDTILKTATEGDFDLIVIGMQGRRGLAAQILGSTAERVLRLRLVEIGRSEERRRQRHHSQVQHGLQSQVPARSAGDRSTLLA